MKFAAKWMNLGIIQWGCVDFERQTPRTPSYTVSNFKYLCGVIHMGCMCVWVMELEKDHEKGERS